MSAKNYVCRGLETGPATGTPPVSVWTKSTWQDLVRFGTFFAHFRRKMEIRKNFLDFACRWEMRLMWRAFLYRGRGNEKRLDLIGFWCLQERGSASAGGVMVECVALLASPGPPPGGSSTGVVGQNCWLGAQWGTGDLPKMVIWCHPIGGETLVTDGQVDDRLVKWSWHSLECTKSSVRVPVVTLSVLRWSVGRWSNRSSWRSSGRVGSLGMKSVG